MAITKQAILFIFCTIICVVSSKTYERTHMNSSLTVEEKLDRITKGYNKNLRPNFHGPPVTIVTNTYIVAVDQVNDVKSDFMVKMYFSQWWNDTRLAYEKRYPGLVKKESLRIVGEIADDIWTPDTYVENEEGGGQNKDYSSVQISKDGEIKLSQRLSLKANCPTMNLKYFPHDVQICNLLMTSYAYPSDELTYKWRESKAVFVGESPIASQYYLEETNTDILNHYFEGANATWTYLKLEFVLRRKIAYYVIRIYLPAILVTLTSWVSFWVDPTAIPARLSLCVITVLAMTTLSYNSQSMVPSVPYVKAVDLYLIISFFFVFGSLLEYAILLNTDLQLCQFKKNRGLSSVKKEQMTLTIIKRKESNGDMEDGQANNNNNNNNDDVEITSLKEPSTWTLDKFSTIVFPAAYLLFHMFYFIIIMK